MCFTYVPVHPGHRDTERGGGPVYFLGWARSRIGAGHEGGEGKNRVTQAQLLLTCSWRWNFKAILKVVGLGESLQSGSSFQILGKEKNGSLLTWSVLAKGIYNWWASLSS